MSARGGRPLHNAHRKAINESHMISAVRNGNIAKVRQYLASGVDANLGEGEDQLLCIALIYKWEKIALLLIERGASVASAALVLFEKYLSPRGAIWRIGREGTWQVQLLANHLDVKNISPKLLFAAEHHLPTLSILLKRGADPNLCWEGSSLLANALERGAFGTAWTLLDAGADPFFIMVKNYSTPRSWTMLHLAIGSLSRNVDRTDGERVVHRLIAMGANVNAQWLQSTGDLQNSVLKASLPHCTILEALLEAGADPNEPGLLAIACRFLLSSALLLIKHGATPSHEHLALLVEALTRVPRDAIPLIALFDCMGFPLSDADLMRVMAPFTTTQSVDRVRQELRACTPFKPMKIL